MAEKFTIKIAALIYDDEGKLLYLKRGKGHNEIPGMDCYVADTFMYLKSDYDKTYESVLNIAEKNLIRTVNEKLNIKVSNPEYFHSHTYVSKDGENVLVLKYLVKLPENSTITINDGDTSGYDWIALHEIEKLNTVEIIKLSYKVAFEELEKRRYHEHIEVAGIVLNEKNEFLVLKEKSTGKYMFPHGKVENLPGRTWEVLEKNLIRNIFSQTAVEVDEGMIPFTDKEFVGKDGFEKIIQFFICKYSRGDAMVTDPFAYSEVAWKKIEQLKEDDFRPLVYTVYKKAFEFINKLNN